MTKREADEVLALAAQWLGDNERAGEWFRKEPIPAFGCRTPKQLVYRGDAQQVKAYIEHLASGGYA